jgi:hypothetical protein
MVGENKNKVTFVKGNLYGGILPSYPMIMHQIKIWHTATHKMGQCNNKEVKIKID